MENKEFKEFLEKYEYLLTNLDLEKHPFWLHNTRFKTNSFNYENAQFETEIKESREVIENTISSYRKYLGRAFKNPTTRKDLETDRGFACYLYFFKEYTKVLNTLKKTPKSIKKEESLIDYSNSKLTEKIIALNEMGVIDFLKEIEPFNFTTNKLAEFLSLCIGEKASSIQSYINPIINNSDQTKSPYNTVKTVEKTKQKLIQMGCKLD